MTMKERSGITVRDIEQLQIIAGTVLRKHSGNIESALHEFLFATADAGLGPDPDNIPQILPALEYTAREYLTAYAKEANR